jgi:plasmid replication initiation protein
MAEQKPVKRRRALKQRTDVAITERHVSMSNALARGAHALTLAEKRIVSMALALTDSVPAKELFDANRAGWVVRITAQDYAETYEVDARTAYEQLKESARGLLKRRWKTVHQGPRGLIFREGLWVSLVEYSEGEGYVSVRFTPEVAPHLLALRKEFTSYKLKQASALRSVYAWRLLECLQSWRDTGRWSPTIEEFQHAMDAPESCRKDFFNLRARIIEPAIKELRQKDNLLIEWKPVKAGRKVTGLTFTFRPDPQGRLPL